ncbi:hypothetical protein [Roseinatronobacter sp. S2]|uniref:hypothetical protein n=1 Tax=Roseinatronobacter sp. S2 TaxID=3035471 RepID=UPI00240F03A2|nr:hypothetical protein [Roseinatronobacter sp. S2]WFE76584.1 hypothetical protein P8S53_18875 [Roseinatronobacter sp. S2]
MKWLGLFLAGPIIWAFGFSLVYALHGTGCNLGWTGIDVLGFITLHHLLLWAGWLAALSANLGLLLSRPAAPENRLAHWLPRAGAWIGLGATFFSLLPVALTSSC